MANNSADQQSRLSRHLEDVARLNPEAPEVEFDSTWWTWGQLEQISQKVLRTAKDLGLPKGAEIGLFMSNRPSIIGALLGLLRGEFCVVTINPGRRGPRLLDDLNSLKLPLLVGDSEVLRTLEKEIPEGATVLPVGDEDFPIWNQETNVARTATTRPGVAIRMLTSGTTGAPKRADLSYLMLERVFEGAKFYESNQSSEVRLRSGIAIVSAPLAHLGGVFRVLLNMYEGRQVALMSRFEVASWVDLVRRHRPKTVSLVPTALKMVLDAHVDPEVFSSVRTVISGTAPLDPDIQDEFAARYNVAVLISFAATEFGGGVAGWTLSDYEKHWTAKRGSVGRAQDGCELRVVDPANGTPLPADEPGLLEIRSVQFDDPDSWLRTTDIARLDKDGFLWIVGRADQTINRGGLKVQPEEVRVVLERQPGVRDAAVIGMPSARLGEVPVAVVEALPGSSLDSTILLDAASKVLARYELPVEIIIVDELPRTDSQKVSLAEVRTMLQDRSYP